MKKYSSHAQGILLGLSAMLTFSINDGIFKYSLQRFPLETVTFTGYLFSLLYLSAYGVFSAKSFRPLKTRNALAYGSFFLVEQTLFLVALKQVPIAELFVVVLATPVAVLAMASLILKEDLARREIAAVLLGFSGAVAVMGLPALAMPDIAEPVPILGWMAAILNVLVGGSKIIYLRKYYQDENTFSLSFFAMLFLTIAYLALLPSSPLTLPPFDLGLLFIGGCIGGWGCIAYIRAFQLSKATLVSATQYSQIIWAVLMGVFIFGESLTPATLLGCLLIVISGYLLYLRKTGGR